MSRRFFQRINGINNKINQLTVASNVQGINCHVSNDEVSNVRSYHELSIRKVDDNNTLLSSILLYYHLDYLKLSGSDFLLFSFYI